MTLPDLVERGRTVRLSIQAFHCRLIGDTITPSDAITEVLEHVTVDSTEILDSLQACGLPTISDFRNGAHRDDEDHALAGMVAALWSAGGVLVQGTVPETRRLKGDLVQILGYIQHSCLFWGPTLDEALAHAVAWAEGQYGKGGVP